jgi:protein-tyrosine phosphatase
MAEAVFQKCLQVNQCSDEFIVDSAGTSNYHIGAKPDPRTLAICTTYDLPIDHRGRQITEKDLIEFDYIIAMDDHNYANICALTQSSALHNKVFKMIDFAPHLPFNHVPDPYYGEMDGFEEVYRILDAACHGLLKKIEIDLNKKFIS